MWSGFISDLFCPSLINIDTNNYALGKGKIDNILRSIRFRVHANIDTPGPKHWLKYGALWLDVK